MEISDTYPDTNIQIETHLDDQSGYTWFVPLNEEMKQRFLEECSADLEFLADNIYHLQCQILRIQSEQRTIERHRDWLTNLSVFAQQGD